MMDQLPWVASVCGDLVPVRGLLRLWLRDRGVVHGPVNLAGGGTSTFYVDGRRVALWSRGQRALGRLLYDQAAVYEPTGVGGPETEAIALTAAVLFEADLHDRELSGFYVRKDVKGHGLQKKIEGMELSAADRIVLLDGVVTTGQSLMKAKTTVEVTGATVVAVLTVLDRQQGAADLDWGGAVYRSLFTKTDLDL